MDWMYKDSSKVVDDEEYLLGRRIDKAVDKEVSNSKVSIPSSIFGTAESSNHVDAVRKIKEDPLEAIREKEIEMRKQLLKNPIQMKKIRKMLEAQKKQQTALAREKMKKAKKKKKKKKSTSSDDDDIDQLLTEKLTRLVKQHGMQKVMEQCRTKQKKKVKKESETESESGSSTDSSSESSSGDERRPKKKNLKDSRSSPYREAQGSSKHSRGDSPKKDPRNKSSYGLSVPEGATKARAVTKKDDQKAESSKSESWRRKPREKLSEKERTRRLKEMVENVSWRDNLRESNIRRYKAEDEKEKTKEKSDYDPDFTRKELSKAMYTGSVEKRIQSNRHNIQRSNNESFTRR